MRALGYPKDLELFRFAIADTPNARSRLDSIVANTAADYNCIWITDNDKVDVIIPLQRQAHQNPTKSSNKSFESLTLKQFLQPAFYNQHCPSF